MIQSIKPNLLAALDTTGKVFGALTMFALPVLIPAIVADGWAAISITAFLGFELLSLWPAILAGFWPAILLGFTWYDVEEDGIRVRTQFLQKTERRVTWEKVTAVRHRRTVLDVVLGLERLDIVAYGERGATLHLVGLRNAAAVRDLISQRMRESATVEALFRGD